MDSNEKSLVLQMLKAYSEKRVSDNAVIGALVRSQNWFAPVMLFNKEGENELFFDKLTMFSQETNLPVDEIWIFTDMENAQRAQNAGALLGLYVNGSNGTEIFKSLNENYKIVRVNPYSPTEETWEIGQNAFELMKFWSSAVEVEKSFDESHDTLVSVVSQYQNFIIYNYANGYTMTLPNQGGLKNPAIVFTTPDCADALLARVNPEQKVGLERSTVDGWTLLTRLQDQNIDGIFFNPVGPGKPTVLFFNAIEDLYSFAP